jgi:general secretion pathway protein E
MSELEISTQATVLSYSYSKRAGVVCNQNDAGDWQLLVREGADAASISEVLRLSAKPLPLMVVNEEIFSQQLQSIHENRSVDDDDSEIDNLGEELDLQSLADSVPETEDLLDQEENAPIIKLINAILTLSIKEGASDIHVETFEKRLVVRFRVDGVLREVFQPKRAVAPLLISRIKVMAKLDIAEKRLPQDGRIPLKIAGREVDVRVSTMPSSHGERVVMRLLDKQAGILNMQQLGLSDLDYKKLDGLIHRPHGIILVTGPTGSGKTTTLYAALSQLNRPSRNIMTVEDPIEYTLPGIGQTQVNGKIDMTFAKGLRAILRQDPDVVMIGEIRDKETSDIAIQASLTGHLVLSTVHTNSAVGAITRLQDMGIEPFLLSSSIIGVVAQRLVRTLCPDCKESHLADRAECEFLGVEQHKEIEIYRPKGCSSCKHSGYRGRQAIYEVVAVDEELEKAIHDEAGEIELRDVARKSGPDIVADGIRKVLQGETTIEEVMRVSRSH